MAALLVSIGVMAILMSAALPVWRQTAKREREAELVFRGEQYARAIGLFQRKYAGAFPPSIDLLIEQRFLRKRYKDPMTEDGQFQVLYQTSPAAVPGLGATTGQGATTGVGSRTAQENRMGQGQRGGPETQARQQPTPDRGESANRGTLGPRGGVTGVVSKSKEASAMLYKGRSRYNEWEFVYIPLNPQPGGLQPGSGGLQPPGGPQRPGQPPVFGSPGGRPPGAQPANPDGRIQFGPPPPRANPPSSGAPSPGAGARRP